MKTSDNTARVWMLRMTWVVGGLAVGAAMLLMIGAVSADSSAGASGQPAAVLGLIALALGVPTLIAGVLARFTGTTRGIGTDD